MEENIKNNKFILEKSEFVISAKLCTQTNFGWDRITMITIETEKLKMKQVPWMKDFRVRTHFNEWIGGNQLLYSSLYVLYTARFQLKQATAKINKQTNNGDKKSVNWKMQIKKSLFFFLPKTPGHVSNKTQQYQTKQHLATFDHYHYTNDEP